MTSILVFLTPFEFSKTLIGILIAAQVISLIMNMVKLYELKLAYFLSIVREIQILFIVTYLFALQYVDQTLENQKVKYFKPFMITQLCIASFVSLVSIGSSVI